MNIAFNITILKNVYCVQASFSRPSNKNHIRILINNKINYLEGNLTT
jgi:hypothetical protein